MSSTIRKPTQQDVPRLHDLIRAHAAFERSAATLTQGELEAFVLDPSRPIRFLVAECEGDLTGYAAVTFDWSVWRTRRYAHLECLRRRGRLGCKIFRLPER